MIRIAFAVFVSVALFNASASAACVAARPKDHPAHEAKKQARKAPCVDLLGVSQISADLVAAEPAPAVKPPSYTPAPPGQYEGPTLSLTKPDPGVKPVPTVGYHWSLQ